jgi:rhodanese-related sulfurtransferase
MVRRLFSRSVFLALLLAAGVAAAAAPQIPRMTKEELKALLGSSNLVVLDLRIDPVWKASATKIPGAQREEVQNVEAWARKYPKEKTIVLYCS